MKANELRGKSAEDLNKQLLTLREEQFKLRSLVQVFINTRTHVILYNNSAGNL